MGTLTIENERVVAAPADRLWEILAGDFENVSAWATGVLTSSANDRAGAAPDGADVGGRVCEVPGFGFTDERFVEFDPQRRVFAYSVDFEKMPGFVSDMQNRWHVVAQGADRSLVRSSISATVSGVMGVLGAPLMRRQFARTVATVLDDLVTYAETGEISERKRAELVKAGRA